jgi:hypothetical protein
LVFVTTNVIGPIVRDNVVVCEPEDAVPVIVTVKVPFGALAEAANVRVLDPPAVTLVGLNEAVAPLGKPAALSATASDDPAVTAVEMVAVPLEPRARRTLLGLTEIEKSDGTDGTKRHSSTSSWGRKRYGWG